LLRGQGNGSIDRSGAHRNARRPEPEKTDEPLRLGERMKKLSAVLQGLGGETSDSVLCMEIAGAHGLEKDLVHKQLHQNDGLTFMRTGERQVENSCTRARPMSTTAFWKGGETYHIIQAMKATGNQPGVIAQWKESVAAWAQMHRTDPDAAAVNAWLPLWEVRPFYSAIELAPLWPALAIATGFTDKWPSVLKSAKRLEHELDFHGLPRLRDFPTILFASAFITGERATRRNFAGD
jgi:hypothetical protein